MLRVITAVCIVAGVSTAFELGSVNLIGFSRTGEFVAWEQYGIYDGSGFPYCQIEVMETSSGEVVASASHVDEGEECWTGEESQDLREVFDEYADDTENEYRFHENFARAPAREMIQPALDSLGIIDGNVGSHCVHHPATDLTEMKPEVRFVTGLYGPGYYASPVFELVLQNVEAEGVDESWWIVPPVVLKLELLEIYSGQIVVLADESTSAGDESLCCYGYGIRDVFTYQDSFIAVVLSRSMPGFEGPDVRYRVVTGRLPGFDPGFMYSSGG